MVAKQRDCLVCEGRAGREVNVTVSVNGQAHQWRLLVCRDCWRAFEAMLDHGAHAQQYALSHDSRKRPLWAW